MRKLHNSDDFSDPNNLRPIGLLSFIYAIFFINDIRSEDILRLFPFNNFIHRIVKMVEKKFFFVIT